MHNLFTILHCVALDNLWVICGSTVNTHDCKQIQDFEQFDISKIAENPPLF